MRIEGHTNTITATQGVPLPTRPHGTGKRVWEYEPKPTGLDWSKHVQPPDPDATKRLIAAGLLTVVTDEPAANPATVVVVKSARKKTTKPRKTRPARYCETPGCHAKHYAKGQCREHYKESRRTTRKSPNRRVDATRIIALYTSDNQPSITAISTITGSSKSAIRRALDRAGIPRRDDRARFSGGGNRHPDHIYEEAARLYRAGLTQVETATTLGISVNSVRRALRVTHTTARPGAHVPGAIAGRDGAKDLRDLMDVNGATSADVRAWAHTNGLDCPTRGVPPRALVEDYLLHHHRKGQTA